MHLRGFASVGN